MERTVHELHHLSVVCHARGSVSVRAREHASQRRTVAAIEDCRLRNAEHKSECLRDVVDRARCAQYTRARTVALKVAAPHCIAPFAFSECSHGWGCAAYTSLTRPGSQYAASCVQRSHSVRGRRLECACQCQRTSRMMTSP